MTGADEGGVNKLYETVVKIFTDTVQMYQR